MSKGQVDLSNRLVDFIDDEVRKAEEYLDFYEEYNSHQGGHGLFLELAKQEFRHAEMILEFGIENKVFDTSVEVALHKKLYGVQGVVEGV